MKEKSFSAGLKAEICKNKPTGCCRRAECYGLLLFSRSFCNSEISIRTECREVAETYASLLRLCFSAHTVMSEGGGEKPVYTVTVPGEADRRKIVNFYAPGQSDWILDPAFVKRNCCREAFIKGAFLACGSINDPEKGYHFEFAVRDPSLEFAFKAFLELCGYKLKSSVRDNVTALYSSRKTDVEEIISLLGAHEYYMKLIETEVLRDTRNVLNRKNNFETANIGKTADAAALQVKAIKYLEKNGELSLLPDEVKEAARLRLENPDASLTQLCRLSENTVSRSGMNHRLQKLIDAEKESRGSKKN